MISVGTKTGYELAQKKYAEHVSFYAPLDFTWAVRRTFARVRPQLLVLAELELWPNLIDQARRRQVPVAIINGRLSDRSWRGYRRVRPFIARVLRSVSLIAAQDQTTAGPLRRPRGRTIASRSHGSLKFDGAATDRHNQRTFAAREVSTDRSQ